MSASIIDSNNLSQRRRTAPTNSNDFENILSISNNIDSDNSAAIFKTDSVRQQSEDTINFICQTNRCAAKIIFRSRQWIRNSAIEAAVNILRTRDGFRTVFARNLWAVYRQRVTSEGIRYWEAVFRYQITGGTSDVDSIKPPDQNLLLTDELLLLLDEPLEIDNEAEDETV